jgi:VanZ family protein
MLSWSKAWEQWYRRALPAYWIFLFCATHFPKPQLPGVHGSDKLAHFLAFAILAFLFWRCAESFGRKLSRRFVWIVFVGLSAYAAVDEYLQEFVHRSMSLADWLADLAGIAAVLVVLELRRRSTAAAEVARADRSEV